MNEPAINKTPNAPNTVMTNVAFPRTFFGHISLKTRKSIVPKPPKPKPTIVRSVNNSQYELDKTELIPKRAAIEADRINGVRLPIRSAQYPNTTDPKLPDMQDAKDNHANCILLIPKEDFNDG